MQNNSQQNGPQSHPEQDNPAEQRKVNMASPKPRVRRFLIYYFFSSLLIGVASFLISWDRSAFASLAIICLAGFFVLAAFGVRLQLINHGSIHKTASVWCWGVVVVGVGLCAFLWWRESRPRPLNKPAPRLSVSVRFPGIDTPDISLTNWVLNLDEPTNTVQRIVPQVCLIVPAASTNSSITFVLIVLNSGSDASDGVQVVVTVSDSLNFVSHQGWVTAEAPIGGSKSLAFRDNNDILTNRELRLPEIVLAPQIEWPSGALLLSVLVEARNADRVEYNMSLSSPTNAERVGLVFMTNDLFYYAPK